MIDWYVAAIGVRKGAPEGGGLRRYRQCELGDDDGTRFRSPGIAVEVAAIVRLRERKPVDYARDSIATEETWRERSVGLPCHPIPADRDPTVRTGFIEEVTKATSFDNMKSSPDRFTPYADRGFWHDPKKFFHSAGTGKWVGQISDATLELYQQKMTAEFPQPEVEWLEHGDNGP